LSTLENDLAGSVLILEYASFSVQKKRNEAYTWGNI